MDADPPTNVRLTDTQLAILAALCRPISSGNHFATPATNQEIADEVFLGVDAVKGHLRTLYRKFGIEDLPHNQKRARLVELAIEGGYLASSEPKQAAGPGTPAPSARADVPLGSVEARGQAEREAAAARPKSEKRSIGPYITLAILILVVIGSTLAISGIFNSSPSAPQAPTPAAFRAEVAGYCKLALSGAPSTAGQDRTARARDDLEVIETIRGRFQSLVQPIVPDIALERFSTGLTTAANYTADVAEESPVPGSEAEAKDVAELTFAAGQVQAGAVGYELGHDCVAVGDLVARSAQNAAAP
ncbi:MAG TPA: hypothetical protein VGI17_08565 [Solirubrobacterales bacterium]|jgi:hypothetical protein